MKTLDFIVTHFKSRFVEEKIVLNNFNIGALLHCVYIFHSANDLQSHNILCEHRS